MLALEERQAFCFWKIIINVNCNLIFSRLFKMKFSANLFSQLEQKNHTSSNESWRTSRLQLNENTTAKSWWSNKLNLVWITRTQFSAIFRKISPTLFQNNVFRFSSLHFKIFTSQIRNLKPSTVIHLKWQDLIVTFDVKCNYLNFSYVFSWF